tara:strand:- start:2197 stop:3027 length:831 start_codon:yes stop_codon:yes gene_type:complete
MNYLITGAPGFLGNEIVDSILNSNSKNNDELILLGHSEKRADKLSRKHGIPVFVGDIQDSYFLENIFRKKKIDRIIHTAAIKYVSISNKNPTTTIETNIIGSYNLIKMAKKYNIKEMVGISTDKALNPMSIYGMTKKLMEELFIEAGFTIVSGVNFFGSSGSVLDIWNDQILQKKPLTITNKNCMRYFIEIDMMVDLVLDSFGKNEIIYPESTVRIKMGDMLDIFMETFDYFKFREVGLLPGEKLEEDIDQSIKWKEADKAHLKKLMEQWSKRFNY